MKNKTHINLSLLLEVDNSIYNFDNEADKRWFIEKALLNTGARNLTLVETGEVDDIVGTVLKVDKIEILFNTTFICKNCKCELSNEFNVRTEGYCYLCDPAVTLAECLSDKPLTKPATPSVGDWINVKDKLPEENQEVLAVYGSDAVVYCEYMNGNFYRNVFPVLQGDRIMSTFFPDIVYWQPLPTPPSKLSATC